MFLNRSAGKKGAKNAEEVLFAPSAAFAVENQISQDSPFSSAPRFPVSSIPCLLSFS